MTSESLPKYMLLNEDAEEIYDERIRTKREDYLDEQGKAQKRIHKRINNTFPLAAPIDHTTSIFNIVYSNTHGLLIQAEKDRVVLTSFEQFQDELIKGHQLSDKTYVKFTGDLFLSPNDEILAICTDSLIQFAATARLPELPVRPLPNSHGCTHFVWANNNTLIGWTFEGGARAFKLKPNLELQSEVQLEGVESTTGASVTGGHLLVIEKLKIGVYSLVDLKKLNELSLETCPNPESFLFEYSFIIQIFKINIHNKPCDFERFNSPPNDEDVYGLVMVYYDDDEEAVDTRFLVFMKGNILTDGEKTLRGDQSFYTTKNSRELYFNDEDHLSFGCKVIYTTGFICIMIEKMEIVYVVDTLEEFDKLNVYSIESKHELKHKDGKFFRGIAHMTQMLPIEKKMPEKADPVSKAIVEKYDGEFLSLFFRAKESYLTVPFPPTLLALSEDTFFRSYAISSVNGIEKDAPESILEQMSKIKKSQWITKVKQPWKGGPAEGKKEVKKEPEAAVKKEDIKKVDNEETKKPAQNKSLYSGPNPSPFGNFQPNKTSNNLFGNSLFSSAATFPNIPTTSSNIFGSSAVSQNNKGSKKEEGFNVFGQKTGTPSQKKDDTIVSALKSFDLPKKKDQSINLFAQKPFPVQKKEESTNLFAQKPFPVQKKEESTNLFGKPSTPFSLIKKDDSITQSGVFSIGQPVTFGLNSTTSNFLSQSTSKPVIPQTKLPSAPPLNFKPAEEKKETKLETKETVKKEEIKPQVKKNQITAPIKSKEKEKEPEKVLQKEAEKVAKKQPEKIQNKQLIKVEKKEPEKIQKKEPEKVENKEPEKEQTVVVDKKEVMYMQIKQKLQQPLNLLKEKRLEEKPSEQFTLKNTHKLIETESSKLSVPDSNILGFPMEDLLLHIQAIENVPAEYERIFSQDQSKQLKHQQIQAELIKKQDEINRIIYFANMIGNNKSLRQKNIATTLSRLLQNMDDKAEILADEGRMLIDDIEDLIRKREERIANSQKPKRKEFNFNKMTDRAEALTEKREKQKEKDREREKDAKKGKAKVLAINLSELDLSAKVELPLMEVPKPKPPPPSLIKPTPVVKQSTAGNFANKIPIKQQKVAVPTITASQSQARNKKAVSESQNESIDNSQENDVVQNLEEGSDDAPFELPSTTRKNSQIAAADLKSKSKEPVVPAATKSGGLFAGKEEEKPGEKIGVFGSIGKQKTQAEKTEGVAEKKPPVFGAGLFGSVPVSTEKPLFSAAVPKKEDKTAETKAAETKTAEKKDQTGSIFSGSLFSNLKPTEPAAGILGAPPAGSKTLPKAGSVGIGNPLKQSKPTEESKTADGKATPVAAVAAEKKKEQPTGGLFAGTLPVLPFGSTKPQEKKPQTTEEDNKTAITETKEASLFSALPSKPPGTFNVFQKQPEKKVEKKENAEKVEKVEASTGHPGHVKSTDPGKITPISRLNESAIQEAAQAAKKATLPKPPTPAKTTPATITNNATAATTPTPTTTTPNATTTPVTTAPTVPTVTSAPPAAETAVNPAPSTQNTVTTPTTAFNPEKTQSPTIFSSSSLNSINSTPSFGSKAVFGGNNKFLAPQTSQPSTQQFDPNAVNFGFGSGGTMKSFTNVTSDLPAANNNAFQANNFMNQGNNNAFGQQGSSGNLFTNSLNNNNGLQSTGMGALGTTGTTGTTGMFSNNLFSQQNNQQSFNMNSFGNQNNLFSQNPGNPFPTQPTNLLGQPINPSTNFLNNAKLGQSSPAFPPPANSHLMQMRK